MAIAVARAATTVAVMIEADRASTAHRKSNSKNWWRTVCIWTTRRTPL
jgi:hypothetical protein